MADICRKAGISQATYFNWKKKYDGLAPKAVKPGRKLKLVDEVGGEWQVSTCKACAALEFDRSTYHYKSRRSGQAALEARIREICHARIRYGYRRVQLAYPMCREKVGAGLP